MDSRIITILGNSELCAEMAYINAKLSHKKILIIDLDVFVPNIHLVLGMKETVNSGISIKNMHTCSSFLQAYELSATRKLDADLLTNISVNYKLKNLYVLSGNDKVRKGESFSLDNYKYLLEVALNTYELIYVNVPFDPYKTLYLYMISYCKHLLIIPFKGDAIDLILKKKMLSYIGATNKFNMDNVKFIAFEHDHNNHLSENELSNMLGSQYLGKIAYCPKRVTNRNSLYSSYVKKMSKKVIEEYKLILSLLNITIKLTAIEKIKLFVKGLNK